MTDTGRLTGHKFGRGRPEAAFDRSEPSRMMKHFSADIVPAREEHQAHPVPTAKAGLPTLLDACFTNLTQTADDNDAATKAPLLQAITELALIERGALRPGSRRGQKALRIARLSMAHRLIAQHLAQPDLSPAMVANLLGISLRHLHVLFEAAEMSFSETVTAMRIRESCRLLRETPERAIADIAQDCGFESLATFYRAFKAAEATTPRDYRAASLSARRTAP